MEEAWLQLGTLLVLSVAAVFAGWQALEVRADRRRRDRPFVVVDFEEAATIFVEVGITNLGTTPAREVTMAFDTEPHTALDGGPWPALESSLFNEGIPLMPPGRHIRMMFDRVPDRVDADLPMTYEATVAYRDDRGKQHRDRYVLDLEYRRRYKTIIRKGLHDAVKELEAIRKALEESR